MKEAQGRVMEVMKELITVEGQLNLCKKRLEISDAYEELDRYYRLTNPVLRHGRDVHPTWVKSTIETLSNTGVQGFEYKGKVQRGL